MQIWISIAELFFRHCEILHIGMIKLLSANEYSHIPIVLLRIRQLKRFKYVPFIRAWLILLNTLRHYNAASFVTNRNSEGYATINYSVAAVYEPCCCFRPTLPHHYHSNNNPLGPPNSQHSPMKIEILIRIGPVYYI